MFDRTMIRLGAAAMALGVTAAGCGDGWTTQEAARQCDLEREAKSTVTDTSYAECIACFEKCGDACAAKGASPERYVCAGD